MAAEALREKEVTPYVARRSGASVDAARKTRSLPEIKKRGRWVSDSSVRSYAQAGRVGERYGKLSEQVRKYGENSSTWLPKVLLSSCSPLVPPFR